MKRILIFGVSGILGNAVYKYLSFNPKFEVYGTVLSKSNYFNNNDRIYSVDISNPSTVTQTIEKTSPDWIINCIVKKEPTENLQDYFYVNSVFPQLISFYCPIYKYRLIHISTNGVFNGQKGKSYKDSETPDADDIYGISKILSENIDAIIFRTSIIGHSVDRKGGLLDWFLFSKERKVKGYSKVFWNGITTLTLAKIIEKTIVSNILPNKPVVQISSNKVINKYELLSLLGQVYEKNTLITKAIDMKENKTLYPSSVQSEYYEEYIKPIPEQIMALKSFYEK